MFKKINDIKNNESGFEMVTAMLVMVIAAIFLVVAFTIFSASQSSAKADASANIAAMISSKIANIYGDTSDYSTITTSILVQMTAVPAKMIVGGQIINGWGGTITALPGSMTGIANTSYALTWTNVEKGECAEFATKLGLIYKQVTIEGVVVKIYGAQTDKVLLATSCSGAATNVVTVIGENN